ncbi:MAG: class I SAM-dependent methyltransferase [Methanomassiliicoccales archaeon]|jgi:ubiquinone/menaquinone biosynthesis C-methylase UbiE
MPHRFDACCKAQLKDETRKRVQPAEEILDRAKVTRDEVCLDIGAGIGYLTIPLALRCKAAVALDSQKEMLRTLCSGLSEYTRSIVFPVMAEADSLPFASQSFDHVFVVNVFHEVRDRDRLAEEVERVLCVGGKLTLVDFHKKPTSFGPPVSERLSAVEAQGYFSSLKLQRKFCLDEFYQLELTRM